MTTEQIQVRAMQAQCKEILHLLLQRLHGSKRVWQSVEKRQGLVFDMDQMHSRTNRAEHDIGCAAHMILQSGGRPQ